MTALRRGSGSTVKAIPDAIMKPDDPIDPAKDKVMEVRMRELEREDELHGRVPWAGDATGILGAWTGVQVESGDAQARAAAVAVVRPPGRGAWRGRRSGPQGRPVCWANLAVPSLSGPGFGFLWAFPSEAPNV